MRLIPFLSAALLLLICQPAGAGQKSITFYLDGARVEEEAVASKGYLEYALPDAVAPGSLRVKPVGTGSVLRVEVVPAERDRRTSREIARLEEKKRELQEKLQKLSRREELFAAAVKSQSGKAPRKSKTNPDPVASLQQGTEFALAQLDAVNRKQRSCQLQLDALEHKLTAARKGAALARIWLSGKKARISYQVASERWTPCYDFRWAGDGSGELLLHARLPHPEKGVLYQVSQGTVAQGAAAKAVQGEFPVLSRYPLTLNGGSRGEAPLSFNFNKIDAELPPGEAAAFWRGEYLGTARFAGAGASEFSLGSK